MRKISPCRESPATGTSDAFASAAHVDRAGYDAYLDREHGPVPPLDGEDAAWAHGVLGG